MQAVLIVANNVELRERAQRLITNVVELAGEILCKKNNRTRQESSILEQYSPPSVAATCV